MPLPLEGAVKGKSSRSFSWHYTGSISLTCSTASTCKQGFSSWWQALWHLRIWSYLHYVPLASIPPQQSHASQHWHQSWCESWWNSWRPYSTQTLPLAGEHFCVWERESCLQHPCGYISLFTSTPHFPTTVTLSCVQGFSVSVERSFHWLILSRVPRANVNLWQFSIFIRHSFALADEPFMIPDVFLLITPLWDGQL